MSSLHSNSYRPAGNGRDTYAIFNIGWSPAHDSHLSDPLLTQIDKWERNVRSSTLKGLYRTPVVQQRCLPPPSHHPEAHYPPQRDTQPRRHSSSGHEHFEQVFTRLNRPTLARQHPNKPTKLASKLRQESQKSTRRSLSELSLTRHETRCETSYSRGAMRTQQEQPLASTDAILEARKLPASTRRKRRVEFRNYGSTSVA